MTEPRHPLAGSGLEKFARPPDTLDALLSEPVPLHAFDIGGRFEGKTLHVRLLTTHETAVARIAARKSLTALGFDRDDMLDETGHDLFELYVMAEIVARALVNPPATAGLDPAPVAKDSEHLRQRMRPAEIEAVYKEYAWFKIERAPLDRMESWEEARKHAEALASGKVSRVPKSLERFDIGTRTRILLSLADLAAKLIKDSSSGTSSPSSSTDDSSGTSESTPER